MMYNNNTKDYTKVTHEIFGKTRTFRDIARDPEIKAVALPEYGISARAAKYFKVLTEMSERTGEPRFTYYPYYDQKGVHCGYKVRDWDKPKGQAGYIFTLGAVKSDCKFFGQKEVEENAKGAPKRLVMVEGEGDVLAAWEAAFQCAKAEYRDYLPHIVGLNTGTPNAVKACIANDKFIRRYAKICLGFDNDEVSKEERLLAPYAVRGKECKEDVAAHISSDNIYDLDWGGYKDPRDMLMAGKIQELNKILLWEESRYFPEKVVPISKMTVEELTKPRPLGYTIPAFPALNNKINGFRKGELVIVTGTSGSGKTVWCSEVAYSLASEHNQKIGFIYLEELCTETALRMIGRRLEQNHNAFKYDPLKKVAIKDFKEAKKWCDERFVAIDHFGSLAVDVLMNKIKYLEHVEGCDFIVLDHLSMLFSGSKDRDERKLIDYVMTMLAAYCASSDVGIIAVSHMKNPDMKPKSEDYFVPVTKEDLRGSGSLAQLSWVVIGIEPEVKADRERGRVRLVVLKNRPWGMLGECDTLMCNDASGLFESDDNYSNIPTF